MDGNRLRESPAARRRRLATLMTLTAIMLLYIPDAPPRETEHRKHIRNPIAGSAFDYSRFDNIKDSSEDNSELVGNNPRLPSTHDLKGEGFNSMQEFLNGGWIKMQHRIKHLVANVEANGCSKPLKTELKDFSRHIGLLVDSGGFNITVNTTMKEEAKQSQELLPLIDQYLKLEKKIYNELEERNKKLKALVEEEISEAEREGNIPSLGRFVDR
mmetsp:Transcript_10663/g.15910  ORF Transcript_10663/g.15910 Transcript_10663/m.15910 type:complete len:214 (+) Transcript_10663:192-833(+)|eukprot:CAMPEP_0167759802 /NCGR_PEP_ID=MMETSP0110_2-20121227/11225_1 /TAXON_ID=629695 /ORGANISM="Gymnochlora sp., Strain CCMP2014" /LENGTH=213 /DNA_ID=CAMNT_0007646227 /DNA_START=185 /DNA_END=826 /DNA_ORIENTATION=+